MSYILAELCLCCQELHSTSHLHTFQPFSWCAQHAHIARDLSHELQKSQQECPSFLATWPATALLHDLLSALHVHLLRHHWSQVVKAVKESINGADHDTFYLQGAHCKGSASIELC